MKEKRAIFFPIQTQFSEDKIFVKRHTLYRGNFNALFERKICVEDKPEASAKHDTYLSIKRKLEDYILQQKDQHKLHINSQEYQLANSKSKFVFRKRRRSQQNKTDKSTITIPSDELKLSFSQLLIASKNKLHNPSIIDATTKSCLKVPSQTGHSPDHAADREKAKKYEKKGGQARESKQLQSIFKTRYLRKRYAKSVNHRSDIRVSSRALAIQSQTEVIVCRGEKSLHLSQLQDKKQELTRINETLKLRNAIRFKLRRRTEQPICDEVGPWSKTHVMEEDEI